MITLTLAIILTVALTKGSIAVLYYPNRHTNYRFDSRIVFASNHPTGLFDRIICQIQTRNRTIIRPTGAYLTQQGNM